MNARWMWITVVGGLVVVQWALLSDARRARDAALRPEVFNPVDARLSDVRREALRTAEQITVVRQTARYARAAADARDAGAPLDVGPDSAAAPWFDSIDEEVALRAAERRLAAWGLEAPRVAVGFYLPGAEGWPERIGRPPSMRAPHFVDGLLDDGRPFCIQLGPDLAAPSEPGTVTWAALDDSPTGPGAFGPCWLHARYGMPGGAVAAWMRATGREAAFLSEPEPVLTDDPRTTRLRTALGWRPTMSLRGATSKAMADRCVGGDATACRAVFVAPASERRLAPAGTLVDFLPGNWLYDLQARYGPERMAAFWTSNTPDVVTAFESAFGVPLDQEMRELGRTRFGVTTTGPSLDLWGWLGLLAGLVVGIGVAGLAVARRTVA